MSKIPEVEGVPLPEDSSDGPEKYGLSLAPEKTRLVDFRRPPKDRQDGKGPGTFDFLGFTHYWERGRSGAWRMGRKTQRARVSRFMKAVAEYCRRHRHDSVEEQHATLVRKIRGHFNYFGVNGNTWTLKAQLHAATRIWLKWLRRRSQRTNLTWERFSDLLKAHPLPKPVVYVNLWGWSP